MPVVLGVPTLGVGELLIILVIIIALFGASKIAGVGSALGGSIREFKKAVREDEGPNSPAQMDGVEQSEQKAS